MRRLPGMTVVVALVAFAIAPAAAHAAWTSTAGPPVVMTGTSADEQLNLRFFSVWVGHSDAAGPGLETVQDFDSAVAGVQFVDRNRAITVNANGGSDALTVDGPMSRFAGDLTFNGGDGDDSVAWSDATSPVGRSLTFLPTSITGGGGGAINWTGTERVTLGAGSGDDRIAVPVPLGLTGQITVGPGDDTVVLGDGVSVGTSDALTDAGPGTDTVDYSAWTGSVLVDLQVVELYGATLSKVAARPASAAPHSGSVILAYDRATGQFSYSAFVLLTPPAQITGSRIAAGTPETDDGALTTLVDTGAGAAWSCAGGLCTRTETDIAFPAGRLGDLRSGTVASVVSTDTGNIRGALQMAFSMGQASGFGGAVTGVENLVGGSGADTLTGSDGANRITGGPGDDTISGTGGNDRLDGGAGTDTLAGGDGDDVITSADGGTADVVRCGAGTDVVAADAADVVDPDCESVSPPRPPTPQTVVENLVPAPPTNANFAATTLQGAKGAALKKGEKLTVSKDGSTVTLVGACHAATTCTTDFRIFLGKAPSDPFASKPKTAPVATGKLTVPAGEARAAPIRLTGAGIKALAKLKKRTSTATIVLRTTDRSGHSRTSSSSVTLTGPKVATKKK